EQQIDPALDDTMSGRGASMGMHESQSRFYENIVGRSYEFWQKHYPKLVEMFPNELKGVSVDDFYKGVNIAECSLVRTEADELTYALHIMVRYEIEKRMISGEIGVDELPKEWNKLYKEYLGVDVPNDKMGVLQDVHWAGGNIGYFPTYALGSAYASQICHSMSKDLDLKKEIGSDNLQQINLWLKEKIHKYGSTMDPKDILKNATGQDFDANYYVDYLIEKYGKIYDIK
nr:carboxypeptidase M32 [Clostridia bacterium]